MRFRRYKRKVFGLPSGLWYAFTSSGRDRNYRYARMYVRGRGKQSAYDDNYDIKKSNKSGSKWQMN